MDDLITINRKITFNQELFQDNILDPFYKVIEETQERMEQSNLIKNPNSSAIVLFDLYKNTKFPELREKIIKHPNFTMEKYIKDFLNN